MKEKLEERKKKLLKSKEQLEEAWQRIVGQLMLIDELQKEESKE